PETRPPATEGKRLWPFLVPHGSSPENRKILPAHAGFCSGSIVRTRFDLNDGSDRLWRRSLIWLWLDETAAKEHKVNTAYAVESLSAGKGIFLPSLSIAGGGM